MSNSKSTLLYIAAALIFLLLLGNGWLFMNKSANEKVIVDKENEINEVEKLKAELEKQYYEALSDLEEMRGTNEELNALIDSNKEELKTQKNKISRLISSDKSSTAELEEARLAISSLIQQRDQYLAEINVLKNDKEALTQRTVQLAEEKNLLQEEVSKERTLNEELVSVKTSLVSEKEDLEAQNLELNKKVDIASVIKTNNLAITGWKVKKNGKVSKKRYAKNIDRLKICFNATENQVVEPGNEKFYLRVINPLGETMAVEDLGSGVLETSNGEEIRYTKVKEFEYDNAESESCLLWEPGVAFSKGSYKVEVYNKGFLAGTGNFNLK